MLRSVGGGWGLTIAAGVCVVVAMAGCGPKRVIKPEVICPGRESAAEALASLEARAAKITQLYAKGKAVYRARIDGEEQTPEQVILKVWIDPPEKVYVQGDSTFMGKAVRLGTNEKEFYIALKPKEVSRYVWGEWGDGESDGVRACVNQLWLGPRSWMDALGMVSAEDGSRWKLSNVGAYDVLENYTASGRLIKKFYIYNCAYEIRRIEYFDMAERLAAVTVLDQYMPVKEAEGWMIPGRLEFSTAGSVGTSESLTVDLSSAEKTDLSQKQALFRRPEAIGFKVVEKIGPDCGVSRQ